MRRLRAPRPSSLLALGSTTRCGWTRSSIRYVLHNHQVRVVLVRFLLFSPPLSLTPPRHAARGRIDLSASLHRSLREQVFRCVLACQENGRVVRSVFPVLHEALTHSRPHRAYLLRIERSCVVNPFRGLAHFRRQWFGQTEPEQNVGDRYPLRGCERRSAIVLFLSFFLFFWWETTHCVC